MDRCCCGRIKDFSEPVILGEKLHERLGDEEAFCGPVIHHEIRDLNNKIIKLEQIALKVFNRYYYWQEIGRELRRLNKSIGSQYGDILEAELEYLIEELGYDPRELFVIAKEQAQKAARDIK